MSYEKKLSEYAKNHLNVLITGTHGIGKSTIVKNIAKNMNLKFKYYSSSTLDPWADLVGIPVPNKEEKTLTFFRGKDIEDAEFIFFDELNRAHPKVLNAVLEIIQFKTINGTPLKNLKMVWAAINPPNGDYQVEDMDPVLVDRFQVYFKMIAKIDTNYLSEHMDKQLAKVLRNWWQEDLSKEQKNIITPRRIEYLGILIEKGLSWKDGLPPGHTFPRGSLDKRLRISSGFDKEEIPITKDNIVNNPEEFIKRIENQPDSAIKIAQQIKSLSVEDYFNCRDLFESLPKELAEKIGKPKFFSFKQALKKLFIDNKIDYKNKYSKIYSSFDFQKI